MYSICSRKLDVVVPKQISSMLSDKDVWLNKAGDFARGQEINKQRPRFDTRRTELSDMHTFSDAKH